MGMLCNLRLGGDRERGAPSWCQRTGWMGGFSFGKWTYSNNETGVGAVLLLLSSVCVSKRDRRSPHVRPAGGVTVEDLGRLRYWADFFNGAGVGLGWVGSC